MQEHKNAKAILSGIKADKSKYSVIHYSCQSFYENNSGFLPRITSIAVCDLDSWQTESFSMHISAQLLGIPFDKIPENYDVIEAHMLILPRN